MVILGNLGHSDFSFFFGTTEPNTTKFGIYNLWVKGGVKIMQFMVHAPLGPEGRAKSIKINAIF